MGLPNATFKSLEISAKGLISRADVKAKIINNTNKGIRFFVQRDLINIPDQELMSISEDTGILAHVNNISSTQRNTVLSNGTDSICLTEHFLAACALANLNNIDVYLDNEELPFGDGSANLWLELFKKHNLIQTAKESQIKLKEEIYIEDPNQAHKYIKAVPRNDEDAETEVRGQCHANFSATYQMDWNHPKIGKQAYTWTLGKEAIDEVANARTFSTETENQMLGLSGWIVGITETDFTLPLRFPDEPSRHKVLDLIGDLYLSGINPLNFQMQVISNQGGHYLNSLLARELSKL
jgi:UDP-3-O-[3-hydroxymyristoyl] N-acetylglucosamine deacetylase